MTRIKLAQTLGRCLLVAKNAMESEGLDITHGDAYDTVVAGIELAKNEMYGKNEGSNDD